MIFGKTFKEIRLARGITIQELADEYVSKSTISRFERAEADMTLEKLVHILDKVKISMREFIFLTKAIPVAKSSLEMLSKAVLDNNTIQLNELASEEWRRYKESGNIYSKLSAIVLDAHYKSLIDKENEINESNIDFLTDYLFQCELWTQFEIVLFASSIAYLPLESSIVLSKEISKKTKLFHEDRQSFETLINTLVNITLVCIKKDRIDVAEEFIVLLQKLEIDETFFLERVLLKFTIGLFNIKKGDFEQGENQVHGALQAMKLAEAHKLEGNFRVFYEKIR